MPDGELLKVRFYTNQLFSRLETREAFRKKENRKKTERKQERKQGRPFFWNTETVGVAHAPLGIGRSLILSLSLGQYRMSYRPPPRGCYQGALFTHEL